MAVWDLTLQSVLISAGLAAGLVAVFFCQRQSIVMKTQAAVLRQFTSLAEEQHSLMSQLAMQVQEMSGHVDESLLQWAEQHGRLFEQWQFLQTSVAGCTDTLRRTTSRVNARTERLLARHK